MDWADLPIIDLAKLENVENRPLLVSQIQDALLTHGFFYVVNHGYRQSEAKTLFIFLLCNLTPEQTERIFDIADVPFTGVSDEEKRVYAAAIKETGSYRGYKFPGYFVSYTCLVYPQVYSSPCSISTMGSMIRLNIMTVSVIPIVFSCLSLSVHPGVAKQIHPEPLRPFLPEIMEFAKLNRFNVLHPILQ